MAGNETYRPGLAAALRCRTNHSFLQAASHPDELFDRAAALGYHALGIVDRHSVGGIVQAHAAAQRTGVKLIVGAEIDLAEGPPLVLWALDRAAYGDLCQLLTVALMTGERGRPVWSWSQVAAWGSRLWAGIDVPPVGRTDIVPVGPARRTGCRSIVATAERYREIFGPRLSWLVSLHERTDARTEVAWAEELSQRTTIPLLAAPDVRYHSRARWPLFEVLSATRSGTTVAQLPWRRLPNTTWALPDRMAQARYEQYLPQASARAAELAQRAVFSLEELRYEYPEELVPPGTTPGRHLARLVWEGAARRYPGGIPLRVRRLLQHELELIAELHYEAYFLTVWDLVRFARSRNILCQGRGSAANSAVCYCLGITAVDPERMDVLFERFVSRERNEAPDIDVDFEHQRREEVLQYLYGKYGRERAAMTGVTITYRLRSAIRDVGKALGWSHDRVDRLARQVEGYTVEPRLAERCVAAGIDPASHKGRLFLGLVRQLVGFPRHRSQHVGGMIMTRGPLSRLVPIERAAMAGRTVIQWNKDDLDQLGMLKVDCLALGMLTALHKTFDLVRTHHGRTLDLASIPAEDEQVYEQIGRGDTVGLFQIESRAQMSMLPRLRPRSFYDLVIEVAIVRPGPIQGQMVHPYLRRRAGEEPVVYPSEAVREVLEKTLGVPIFQEQAMRLAVVAAGFTPGEADQLRRAMGAWRRPGVIDRFRRKLIEGMQANGYHIEFAEQIFQQIRGFGEYGFPESHAASFALLVYASAWLRHYFPAAYTAAMLNSQPLGFYAPAQLIDDARRHGVEVRPIDVRASRWDCSLEPAPHGRTALRLGFRLVRGLSAGVLEPLWETADAAPFSSLHDVRRRVTLPAHVWERLLEAGAFDSLEPDRRRAWWVLLEGDPATDLPLWGHGEKNRCGRSDTVPSAIQPLPDALRVLDDYRATGFSLAGHPMESLRNALRKRKVVCAAELPRFATGDVVRVAGLVLLRQRPATARGITFVTLEDETGPINLVVHQATWDRFREIARTAPVWLVRGTVQSEYGVIHVIASTLENLVRPDTSVPVRSRDFR